MRYGRTPSSSLENRDSLLNALNLFDREGELVRSLFVPFLFAFR